MKIAKEFKWEMGHRLPFHKGKCKNLHGHTYRCMVEIDGAPDENGMVLDYYELKRIIDPIIEEMDHSFMVCSKDTELMNILKSLETKTVVVDFDSTAENICLYLLDRIKKAGLPENIKKVKVRVLETENSYAEDELSLR
ncbi:6-pyruvoyl tetrahydrobiopterin synthase [Melioribacter roseus P3M-2]|uniref:6-carboxy-5,6,7,8-tetrahydropterin synthase n=2 Tax=Melioribacteraceae TaxID=1334117 RepID=I7A1D7_MELRP|nr:6-pyruvoyl tetrahydrobiopterin synthase [Melioribacter roseus P3M-2]